MKTLRVCRRRTLTAVSLEMLDMTSISPVGLKRRLSIWVVRFRMAFSGRGDAEDLRELML